MYTLNRDTSRRTLWIENFITRHYGHDMTLSHDIMYWEPYHTTQWLHVFHLWECSLESLICNKCQHRNWFTWQACERTYGGHSYIRCLRVEIVHVWLNEVLDHRSWLVYTLELRNWRTGSQVLLVVMGNWGNRNELCDNLSTIQLQVTHLQYWTLRWRPWPTS